MVIGTAIVAKFLQNKPGSGFWQSSYLLSMLQALVAQNYEGANATTGFLCVAKTAELTDDFCGQDYELQRFEKPVRLREDFFANPISYRYVDGRNAFYVIDRQSDVQGIVRVRQPLNWSLVDRAQGRHLQPLISRLQGKVWAAIVGNTRDIQIITRLGPEIRWNRNRWQYLHLEQIRTYLAQFTRDPSVAGELLQLVFALSASRRGSLILIPRSDERPTYLGGLDLERVEAQIERTIVGASLNQFVQGAGMFGVFGSDGLVVVKPDGIIEAAGRIISLSTQDQQISGGGRTQAALACSRYGITIKVSEDGPISFFLDHRLVLQTNG